MAERCAHCGGQTKEALLQGFADGDSHVVPIGRMCNSCGAVEAPNGLRAPADYKPTLLSKEPSRDPAVQA